MFSRNLLLRISEFGSGSISTNSRLFIPVSVIFLFNHTCSRCGKQACDEYCSHICLTKLVIRCRHAANAAI